MKARPRKKRARKVTLKPRRRKARALNDDDAEDWMVGQPSPGKPEGAK